METIKLMDKARIAQTHLSGKPNRGTAAESELNRKTVDKHMTRHKAELGAATTI